MTATVDEMIDGACRKALPGVERLMLAELAHRMANDLGVVMGLLHALGRAPTERTAAGIEEALGRIRGVAATQRLLIPPLRDGTADLKATLESLGKGIVAARLEGGNVGLFVKADPCTIDAMACWTIATLVAEAVTNSIKHAFGGGAGTIVVTARVVGRMLLVKVDDDGTRRPAPRQKGGTGGGEIVDALVGSLGASFRRTTGAAGTAVEVWVRLDGAAAARPCGATVLAEEAAKVPAGPPRLVASTSPGAAQRAVARLGAFSISAAGTPLRRLLGVVFNAAARRPSVVSDRF